MGRDEGDENLRRDDSAFEKVECVHRATEYEEFSEELELAFPEDTITYEELIEEDSSAVNNEGAASHETATETQGGVK